MWFLTTSSLPTVVPVTINFMPSWWHQEYGVCYGERMFADPDYRVDVVREMRRLSYDRFADIGLGEADPEPKPVLDNLSNATIPAVFGCEVIFADDKFPANKPLPPERLEDIGVPADLRTEYPMREIIRQADYMARRFDCEVAPTWSTMGVQNIAVQVRGSELFLDYTVDPERADRLLDTALRMIVSSFDCFIAAGAEAEVFWNQNCTVPLVGPDTYRNRLLPYEQRLYEQAKQRGLGYAIHHCGLFDEYAAEYRRVPNVDVIDVGWGSDLRLVLDMFPEALVQYIVGHQFVKEADPSAIRERMGLLLDALGDDTERLRLSVPDLACGTPDENVRAIVDSLLPSAT